MLHPNTHFLEPKEMVQRMQSLRRKVEEADLLTLAIFVTKIWLYFLFMCASLIFTVISAVKITVLLFSG